LRKYTKVRRFTCENQNTMVDVNKPLSQDEQYIDAATLEEEIMDMEVETPMMEFRSRKRKLEWNNSIKEIYATGVVKMRKLTSSAITVNNKGFMPYLDVQLTWNEDNVITFGVYRKPM